MKTLIPLLITLVALPLIPAQAAQTAAPPPSQSAAQPSAQASPGAAAKFSLDTPIEELAADPGAKDALNATLPGLLEIPQYEMIKGLSLRQLQPYSGGKLTDELLAKTEVALAKVP
ncbi:hypothetical protein [Azospirillum sp. B4]|uniref:hypothetical protein n=1 Tax=Azospirillum sp. B4 TaxID=95605 RepID=UPI0003494988|nr:hypothetical protein [Azospirillum sp. B4]